MIKAPKGFLLPFHVHREAATLTLLSALAIVLFTGVTAISRVFHAQQEALSERWSSRGFADLNAGRYKNAANEFHSALRYSQVSYSQQLGLAEALIGMKHVNEASVYLTNLWEQQPENGVVNRELARIAAGKTDTRRALRYYHNAIYANWPTNPDEERRNTRWELIKYLLSLDYNAQAQSELISLAADIGADPAQQTSLGDYFLQVEDNQHALASFRSALAANPRSEKALAGAGTAALNLGEFRDSQHYLQKALQENPSDQEIAARLETASLVLHMDPFRNRISSSDHDAEVIAAFAIVGDRLKSCPAVQALPSSSSAQVNLQDAWNQLKPQVTSSQLRKDPDSANQIMDLVFNVERQAVDRCGRGSSKDAALFLISKLHEGS